MNKSKLFLSLGILSFLILSFSFVSAVHSWWHFWGEEPQYAYPTSSPTPYASSSPSSAMPSSGGSGGGSEVSCMDTDGGKNYDIKGTVNASNGTSVMDYCIGGGNYLSEQFCNADGTKGQETYNCANGCENGKCKEGVNPTNPNCTDTDNGIVLELKGFTNYTNSSGQPTSSPDVCINSNELMEFYCQSGEGHKVIKNCENGCFDGECKNRRTDLCIDTDGGLNFTLKGFTNFTNETGQVGKFEDICLSENGLKEYACNLNGSLKSQLQVCENGCFDGECLSVGEFSCTDDDNGLNKAIRGYVNTTNSTGGIDRIPDVCTSSSELKEYYCDGSQNKSQLIICDGACFDGKCIVDLPCFDTDNGVKPYLFGIVNFTNTTGGVTKINDVCISSSNLIEYSCNENGGLNSAEIFCANGCSNGTRNAICIDDLLCGNGKVEVDNDEQCDDGNTANGDGCSSICRTENIGNGGRIFKVTSVINQTGVSNDKIELTDVRTGDVYKSTVTSDGIATITLPPNGKAYTVKYYGGSSSDYNFIQMEAVADNYLPEEKILPQRAFRNSHIVMGNPEWNGVIAKVTTIINQSGFSNDRIDLINSKTAENYRTDFLSEGIGNINIQGKSYNVKMNYWTWHDLIGGEFGYISDGHFIELESDVFGPYRAFRNSFVVFKEDEQPQPTECMLTQAYWSAGGEKTFSYPKNTIINLTVTGSDCEGMELLFRPLEDDYLTNDDISRVNPPNGVFKNGIAQSTWIVEDQLDEGWTKPEYYFIAGLKDDSTKNIKSGLLIVI